VTGGTEEQLEARLWQLAWNLQIWVRYRCGELGACGAR
jgi:hypothetical protein